MKYIMVLLVLSCTTLLYPQSNTGIISGTIIDKISKQPLPGVNIQILGTLLGASSDLDGNYLIRAVPVGLYQVRASFIGFDTVTKSDVTVNSARPAVINFELAETSIELEGITVTSDYFDFNPTEVNSIKSFSYEEIRRAPGGFEDVVRALSVLPGVAQASAGRNDLVVRGGAPSENLFIVDGFTVPNINHFGTQGATGGPLSFINLDFVDKTTFSTGGFSAMYGDKLSSVLKIDLRQGRSDHIGGKALISATQFGFNSEGPISDNANFIFSARRSYLDFIFNAAGFNFVPEYYDVLAKIDYNIDTKNKISYLFVSAFDHVNFNNKDEEDIYDNANILGSNQIQYVTGISYRRLIDNGYYRLSLSRNFVDYDSFQNDTLLQPLFRNNSREGENELKAELVYKLSGVSEINLGASVKAIKFSSDILFPDNFRTSFGEVLPVTSFSTEKRFMKYGAFAQYSNMMFSRLRVNLGLRADYFSAIEQPLTLNPRFSASYMLDENTSLNLSTGLYSQFPSYIWLAAGQNNKNLTAVKVIQYIAGIERRLRSDTRIKLEAFYKDYSDYPASLIRPYLVLANTGAGYGGASKNFESLGLEPLTSAGSGTVQGLELSLQKKSSELPYYGILSATYSVSQFEGLDNIERTGAYDQTWILSISGGYIFDANWEASLKFRASTGNPFTPYNNDGTQSIKNYLTERFEPSHSLDLRVDRRWDFNGWSMITYLDIQNIYNNKNVTNITWNYKEKKADTNASIGILPSIGINIEF